MNLTYIEKDLPVEQLNLLAKKEGNAKRPIYQIHKWWARRLGSVFRMLILSSFLGEHESEGSLWQKFYHGANLKGKIILDPFMGGGTTIVEALRLGCKVVGIDINPVAWFITKKEIENTDFDKLDKSFSELEETAGKLIKSYYVTKCPKGHHAEVMYVLWVKKVVCEKCGNIVKLFSNYLISHKKDVDTILCPDCLSVFKIPTTMKVVVCPDCGKKFDPNRGVARRGRYTCPSCGKSETILQAVRRRKSPLDTEMFAIEYYCKPCGRGYKKVGREDKELFEKAKYEFKKNMGQLLFPRQKIPLAGRSDPRPVNYGYRYFYQMFNERQLLCLSILLQEILKVTDMNVREYLLIAFSDCLDTNNMFCKYESAWQKISLLFGFHAYHPIERPTENNVWGTKYGRGTFIKCYNKMKKAKAYALNPYEMMYHPKKKIRTLEKVQASLASSFEELLDENKNALLVAGNSENLAFIRPKSIDAVITDPPYFANVMYSELADFFYVWLRLGLKDTYPWFEPEQSWRDEEIVMNEKLGKTSDVFIKGLTQVFKQCHTVLKDKGILLFTFHHNKLWAWEHITSMLLDTGFYVSSCLIVRSEGKSGYHSSLGNVKYDACIVCRKRRSAPSAEDWSSLVTKIKDYSSIWVNRIRKSGMTVNYVDLIVIVMGKFLEFYTKHWPKVTSGAETVNVHRAIEDMKTVLSELTTYHKDEEETHDSIPSTAEVVTPLKIRAREYPKYRKDWKT